MNHLRNKISLDYWSIIIQIIIDNPKFTVADARYHMSMEDMRNDKSISHN